MSWKEQLRKGYDIDAIKRYNREFGEEVERTEFLIENEDIIFNFVEDVIRLKRDMGYEEAFNQAIDNIRPSSKYDKDILGYTNNLRGQIQEQSFEEFRKDPIASMKDALEETVYYFGREGI